MLSSRKLNEDVIFFRRQEVQMASVTGVLSGITL